MDDDKELEDAQWLDADDDLAPFLKSRGWLDVDESIQQVEPAGEGNMNWTLRVVTERRSLILKQSRPWVAKFPAIDAPVERALYEIRFYQAVASIDSVSSRMPELLGTDASQYLLVLEDLGAARDGSFLYGEPGNWLNEPAEEFFKQQIDWLADLHRATQTSKPPADFLNLELRKLNHEHIYSIPLMDPPALDVDAFTPGLSEVANWVRRQPNVVETCYELGERYLAELKPNSRPSCLLHGDYYPGSWLYLEDGIRVIDPEFCFYGPPEFDLSVMVAHAVFAGYEPSIVSAICGRYEERSGICPDLALIRKWAGVEILRRLLGYAQLPLERDLRQKREWIEWAVELMK